MAEKKERVRTDLIPNTTLAMYDESKVESVTIGVTIPLGQPYSNIKMSVTAKDPQNCRLALIDILMNEIPARGQVDREYINSYVRNVLVRETVNEVKV